MKPNLPTVNENPQGKVEVQNERPHYYQERGFSLVDTWVKTLIELDFSIGGHHSQRQNVGTNGHEAMSMVEISIATKGVVINAQFQGWNSIVVVFTNTKTLSTSRQPHGFHLNFDNVGEARNNILYNLC